MGSKADFLENEILDHVLGNESYSAPEGTFYWDSTNRKLYINYDSGTGWVLIGPP